ncbi:MAG: ATP-dependent Clp protease proteolytic subunit [Candidatus Yonathbacteria bacterium]|nr:ATP-dependent Clp protease proteolytic subunit [Candidatus Yonathbacteria bacterium]
MNEKKESNPSEQSLTTEDKNLLDTVKLKEIYDKSLLSILNVQNESHKELSPILQRIADENKVVLLSFIAPFGGKRISPYDTQDASIRVAEELGVDKAVNDIKTLLKENGFSGDPNLFLLLNSPGGYVSSFYIVSKIIRNNFGHISVFVPNVAASGGTLLALAGNEIVMGEMSRLSPIDTQVSYRGETVSAQTYSRALEKFEDYFKDKTPYEAPYVWKSMAEKFDPILKEEWDASLRHMVRYVSIIMKKAGYKQPAIDWIIQELIFTNYPHEFVIDRDRAKDRLDLNIKRDTDYPFFWQAMKAWYSIYATKSDSKHYIRYILPNKL